MTSTCPHCLTKTKFDVMANAGPNNAHQIQRCQACQEYVYRMVGPDQSVMAQWPLVGIRSPHSAVPTPIGADWYEAHLCVSIRAFRAAAAMARRAVQGVAIEQGAKGNTLNAQLKDLEAKATLHHTLIEWAEHIRLLGSSGAHPGADGLETVSEEEAAELCASSTSSCADVRASG